MGPLAPIALLLTLTGAPSADVAKPVEVVRWGHSFYYPASQRGVVPHAIPLVVLLHGCQQNRLHALWTTRIHDRAEELGFAVLLPEQSRFRNPWKCWNWFLGDNTPEMDEVVALVRDYQRRFNLLRTRTYVMGVSAGGVMTAHLLACHPEVFDAGAVISGAAFHMLALPRAPGDYLPPSSPRTAAELSDDVVTCARTSAFPRPVSVLVIHGSADFIAPPRNGEQVAEQFAGANHLLVHGRPGLAAAQRPVSTDVTAADGWKLGYTVKRYPVVDGERVELVQVHGLGHSWSGGPWWLPLSDDRGPDATRMVTEFFGLHAAR